MEHKKIRLRGLKLCGISYESKGRQASLANLGLHLVVEKTAWFVAVKVDSRQGFIVFRGTASVRDVITDLAAHPTDPIATYSAYDGTSFINSIFIT